MLKSFLDNLASVIYACECALCPAKVRFSGELLCKKCLGEISESKHHLKDALIHPSPAYIDHAWSTLTYEGRTREALQKVKFNRRYPLIKTLSKVSASTLQAITSECRYDALIPVPMHYLKYIQRHFNPAEMIARELSQWTYVPVKRSLLKKHIYTPAQSSLSYQERLINPYGTYKACAKNKIAGKMILLIDDIYTTGATANEAARVLKEKGAKRVDLFVLANTKQKTDEKPKSSVVFKVNTVS